MTKERPYYQTIEVRANDLTTLISLTNQIDALVRSRGLVIHETSFGMVSQEKLDQEREDEEDQD